MLNTVKKICKIVLLYYYRECRKPSASKKKGLLFTINDNIVSFGPFLSKRSKANFFCFLACLFVLVVVVFYFRRVV